MNARDANGRSKESAGSLVARRGTPSPLSLPPPPPPFRWVVQCLARWARTHDAQVGLEVLLVRLELIDALEVVIAADRVVRVSEAVQILAHLGESRGWEG
eukprot:scaffold9905_cov117-Isochrysis_galbana.AAC.15